MTAALGQLDARAQESTGRAQRQAGFSATLHRHALQLENDAGILSAFAGGEAGGVDNHEPDLPESAGAGGQSPADTLPMPAGWR